MGIFVPDVSSLVSSVGLSAEVSPASPLGTITSIASAPLNSDIAASVLLARRSRLMRWALQAESRRLLRSEHRLGVCFRTVIPGHSGVSVYHVPSKASAHYGSLIRCGSVWLCPVCAGIISERRRRELEGAVTSARAAGAAVYLESFTVAHQRRDSLSQLLGPFLDAIRAITGGRAVVAFKRASGFIGSIRALEVTYGANGWHPHCHRLVFLPQEVSPEVYADWMRGRWLASARRYGLDMNEHGYDFRSTFGDVGDYISKWGHAPELELPWGVSAEMAKAHIKQGRAGNRTPFGLLRDSLAGVEGAGALFAEYARWFKGRNQLVWSQGLRDILAIGSEVADEELVNLSEEDAQLLGCISPDQWRVVLANDARGDLLEVARGGDWSAVASLLADLGA